MYFGFAFFNQVLLKDIFKKATYKDISAKRIIGGIFAGLALSLAVIAVLFKVESWPGSIFQMWLGIFALSITTLIAAIKRITVKDNYYSKILKRTLSFGAICIILVAMPAKPWLEWKYPDNPDYVKAVLDARADPENQELWDKVNKEREIMIESRKNQGW